MEGLNGIIVLTGAVAVGILGLIVYSFINMAMRLRRSQQSLESPGNVGFVVDTFHELVAQLKEKERELERLRLVAEDKASTIEGYNESILQSVPSGVISLDASGAIVKLNSAAMAMLERDDIVGADIKDILAEARLDNGELQYNAPSGRTRWLGYSVSPLTDARAGQPIGRLMVISDLTELRAYQSQAELRRRLESLGELAAGIAHELRNPLGVIAGYMKLIERRSEPSLKPSIDSVQREVALMDSIIADFLSFARPRKPSPTRIDLCALVRECVESVPAQEVRFTLDLAPTMLVADDTMLRQALRNLIQNAVEALGPEPREVAISVRRANDTVRIEITDSGCGIPPQIAQKIFLPFFTTKEKGTGLGLAITHGAVTMHGGSIIAAPRADAQGTRFTITLSGGEDG